MKIAIQTTQYWSQQVVLFYPATDHLAMLSIKDNSQKHYQQFLATYIFKLQWQEMAFTSQ